MRECSQTEITQIDQHALMHRSIKSQHAFVQFNSRNSAHSHNIFSCIAHSQTILYTDFHVFSSVHILFKPM